MTSMAPGAVIVTSDDRALRPGDLLDSERARPRTSVRITRYDAYLFDPGAQFLFFMSTRPWTFTRCVKAYPCGLCRDSHSLYVGGRWKCPLGTSFNRPAAKSVVYSSREQTQIAKKKQNLKKQEEWGGQRAAARKAKKPVKKQ